MADDPAVLGERRAWPTTRRRPRRPRRRGRQLGREVEVHGSAERSGVEHSPEVSTDRRDALRLALFAAGGALVFVLVLAASQGGPQWFVHFGRSEAATTPYAREVLGDDLLTPEEQGHDGAMFWMLARDPLLLDAEIMATHVDRPVYRSQRMLYPLVSAPWRLLGESGLFWGLVLTNVALIGVGTYWSARLAVSIGAPAASRSCLRAQPRCRGRTPARQQRRARRVLARRWRAGVATSAHRVGGPRLRGRGAREGGHPSCSYGPLPARRPPQPAAPRSLSPYRRRWPPGHGLSTPGSGSTPPTPRCRSSRRPSSGSSTPGGAVGSPSATTATRWWPLSWW